MSQVMVVKMLNNNLRVFLLFCVWSCCSSQSNVDFLAAVVEYQPSRNSSDNFKNYINIIENIKQGVDFIVFPESTLTVNHPVEALTPNTTSCNSNKTNLDAIACLAKEKQSYIIVNIDERRNCTKDDDTCPSRGYFVYNTNVIYGKNGSLVAKYRKWNLFGEVTKNKPSTPDIITFQTDKGTFGTFTCFDILFSTPPLNLTRNGVKNIIFTTMWFSELPFLTALQTQQMWARENNVTFLSSGANNMAVGSGGSAIILSNRVTNSLTIEPDLNSTNYAKVLYSDVVEPEADVDVVAKSLDKMKLKQDNLKEYTSTLLPEIGNTTSKICHQSLCCYFEVNKTVTASHNNSYYYRLVAYSGVRSFSGVYNGGIDVCGVVACTDNKTVTSCSERLPNYESITWPILFSSIKIRAEFPNEETRIQFPNSLLSSLRPMSQDAIKWEKTINGTNVVRELTLLKPTNRLMTFAIYGRNFKADSDPLSNAAVTSNEYNYLSPNVIVLLIGSILFYI
ncbi:vanin-like protein 2 [Aethina tumida]|uniref:vanin-like protein 2 n=1 Tax=Aethina tumida TaxID=116153 RepID=UPI0021481BF2|nr:vanin-like protein 2 [Aethina tumida]